MAKERKKFRMNRYVNETIAKFSSTGFTVHGEPTDNIFDLLAKAVKEMGQLNERDSITIERVN